MRIVLLNDRIPPENRGGAGAVVWRLAHALGEAGHDVHVIAATEEKTFSEEREGIPTHHLHSDYPERLRAWRSLNNPFTIPLLRKLYHEIQPDVVNGHNIHRDLSYASLRLANQMGIPTVFSSHDVMPFAYHKLSHFIDRKRCDIPPEAYRLPPFFNLRQMRFRYNPLRNRTIRRLLTENAQARTVPSQALADAHRVNDLPPFTVVHNGIDAGRFQASDEAVAALRERLGLEGRRVLLFAGRLTGAKGTRPLLNALRHVAQEIPQAALLVLSSTPIDQQITAPEFAELARDHLVSGGWLAGEELAAAFHLAHAVVAPSVIFDTFPTVILEAMAARKPAVAACYGGASEAIVEGQTGYVINPYDTQDFAAKLVRVLGEDALRERMGAAGYQRVTTVFPMERQVREMVALYEAAREKMSGSRSSATRP